MRFPGDLKLKESRRSFFKLFFLFFYFFKFKLASTMEKYVKTGWFTDLIFFEQIFNSSHPENPKRLIKLVENIKKRDYFKEKIIPFPIRKVEDSELMLVHDKKHLFGIKNTHGKKIEKIARSSVGAALSACDSIIDNKISRAFVASRPPGHHARNDGREEGFCFYNNVAIAAKYLQKNGFEKILIVDWDYHHGDGTEYFFYQDPSVLFFSTHDWNAYPGTGAPERQGVGEGHGFNINVHLPCGSGNIEIERAFTDILLPNAEKFKPDFVLISAGFDSREKDPLGCFIIDDFGFRRITQIVLEIANKFADGKILSILEGGYNPIGVASSAEAHIEELFQNKYLKLKTSQQNNKLLL